MRLSGTAWLVGMALALLPGCLGPATTLLPEGHTLLGSTRDLRQPAPWPLPRELAKEPLPPYTVEPGDVLLLQPANLDSPVRLPGDQPVLPDGTINLGPFGHLQVAGRTVPEIEAMVKAAVEVQVREAGFITVRLVTRASKVYYVLGEVNAPGVYPLHGRETVLDGIVTAGGVTDKASRYKIVLSRPTPPDSCRVVLPICYPEIVQHGATTTNYQLAPGDRIYVPSRCLFDDLCALFKKDCTCGPPSYACPGPCTP